MTTTQTRPVRKVRRPRYQWVGLVFLLPSVALISLVYLVPLVDNIRYSLADATLLRGFVEWTGLENYEAWRSPQVIAALVRTLIWLAVTLPAALILGTGLALALDNRIPGRALLRVIVILPWLFPEAVFAVMWRLTLHPHLGLVNNLLLQLGIIDSSISFLSVGTAFPTVIGIRIWRGTPFVVLSVLAGLQAIPNDLLEAARVDGATTWQTIWRIKLPLLRPVIWATGIILSAWTLVIFDLIFVLTGGGPARSTELLSIYVYQAAFARQDLGEAAAVSMMLVAIVGVLGFFYVRSTTRGESDVPIR